MFCFVLFWTFVFRRFEPLVTPGLVGRSSSDLWTYVERFSARRRVRPFSTRSSNAGHEGVRRATEAFPCHYRRPIFNPSCPLDPPVGRVRTATARGLLTRPCGAERGRRGVPGRPLSTNFALSGTSRPLDEDIHIRIRSSMSISACRNRGSPRVRGNLRSKIYPDPTRSYFFRLSRRAAKPPGVPAAPDTRVFINTEQLSTRAVYLASPLMLSSRVGIVGGVCVL